MGLRVLDEREVNAVPRERIIVYGRAGIGKSRFVLSIPNEWGKIVYYAADTNSELLSSISPQKQLWSDGTRRIYPVVAEGDDPIVNFMQFCMTPWKEKYPDVGTLIVDTYTKVALDTISYAANSQTMDREKHYVIGDPKNGGQAIPNRGDYQAIEGLSRGYLDMLFTKQRDMHIIFVCHEDVKIIENVHSIGGPAHPGRAMTEYLPAQFSTVIRLIRESILIPGEDAPEDRVVALTENDGKFIAKVRTNDESKPNPIGKVFLDRDPSSYWRDVYCPLFAKNNSSAQEKTNE